MPDKAVALARRLQDKRSGRVIFLSHCLLNQNTRYLGGACRSCCVQEIIQQCIDLDIGIVQMPCPEERAWGGVLKRRFLWMWGLAHRHRFPPGAAATLGWIAHLATRRIYRGMARQTARQIQDYTAAGFDVVGVVGVDGSPSCGVTSTMDIARSVAAFADLNPKTSTVAAQNAVAEALNEPGQGIFIEALQKELSKRRLQVRFLQHDLLDELRGARSRLDLSQVVKPTSAT